VAAGATDVKAHAVISNNSVEARTTTQQATGLMTVAVVGLGAMGLAMARRLSSVFAVRGFDPVSERKALALAAGLEVADSASAAASGGDFVVLAVRDIRQVDDALFGPSGVVEGLAARSIVILTSTVGAAGARRVAERLMERSLSLLDLPVSGGPARAATGDLAGFLGGAPEITAKARPVLERLASPLVLVGPRPGDGQAMKTVNQLLCGVHIAAAAEALALAKAVGLDLHQVLEALSAGAAASFMLTNRGPRIVEALTGTDPELLSAVAIFEKDMGIVSDAARGARVALPVASAAEQLFRLAGMAGLAQEDDSTIATLLVPRASSTS
jgi:3-hydroxyisobutyrate dehydrogenase